MKRRSGDDIIVDSVVNLVISFLGAWFLMIGVGIVHHEWLHQLPTIGWWPSVLVFFAFRAVVVSMTHATSWGTRE